MAGANPLGQGDDRPLADPRLPIYSIIPEKVERYAAEMTPVLGTAATAWWPTESQ